PGSPATTRRRPARGSGPSERARHAVATPSCTTRRAVAHSAPTNPGAPMRVWPGCPYPLGATWTGEGVNFALFSEHATAVELCLFDRVDDAAESRRVPLRERTNAVWHASLPDLRPGALYAFRAHGP